MDIVEIPVIPDSYKRTVINYHLCQLVFGHTAAERVYRKRIAALAGWIQRKRPSHLTWKFVDICLSIACDDAEKLANYLYAKNPRLTSLDEWGIV